MFEPTLDTKLFIDGQTYSFSEVRGIPYKEWGKASRVFKISSAQNNFGLKVFFPSFRNSSTLRNTKKISSIDLPGLSAANRKLLSKAHYPELIRKHKDLENAILMPWVHGLTWNNYLAKRSPLSVDKGLKLAKELSSLLSKFEQRKLAHCDISSKNVVFNGKEGSIQLVDIEEMYGEDFFPPEKTPAGSPGYAPKWVLDRGLWQKEADRYAAGLILSEMIVWSDKQVRKASAGESFFNPQEVGLKEGGERFELMKKALKEVNPQISDLFEQTWFATRIKECPTLENWNDCIPVDQSNLKSLRTDFVVTPDVIDFGIVKPATGSIQKATKVTIQNKGAGSLTGKISHPNWIRVSEDLINIPGGQLKEIRVSLLADVPGPKKGKSMNFPKVVVFETNAGIKVVGGKYRIS